MGKQLKSKLNMETIETFVTEVVYDINEDVSDSKLLSDISKNLSDSVSIKQNIKDNNSVYLFIYNNILDFNLVPFKSINDAISQAVNYIENVKIIHKGRIIKWDVINNNTAFYINPYNKKIRIIKLEE